ncbi:MAG: O-antigen ligase family protein [Cytophagaceae bacterium]|nr:O-antigen ligase family protein [Cytophagaceae bacterium]
MLIFIAIHLVMGVAVKYAASLVAMIYAASFALFVIDVFITRDRNSRAGFYCLYLMGMEMIYRMVGAPFSWELGKYVSVLILLFGMLFGRRKYIPWAFIFLLFLLIPAIFLAENPDPVRLRKMIMFNISGPLTLVFSGLYFYCRPIYEEDYMRQLKFSFLPAFTVCAALSVMANIADLEFTSLQSNAEASGGFGANQVSTVLGWFILLGLLLKFNRSKITPFEWFDWGVLFYLLLRALLTFSRGGVMGAILALAGSIAVLYFSSPLFRKQMKKLSPYILLGIIFLVGVFILANNITGGMLLFRYRGFSTNEMLAGATEHKGSMLTGRGEIMQGDFHAFTEEPFWGVGLGMGELYRAIYYGHAAAAHTEFARLLSEHGTFGILFMLLGMICLPVSHFFKEKGIIARCFFIALYLLGMFTMFHAAMRLALPGILFGASFMHIISKPKETPITAPDSQDL